MTENKIDYLREKYFHDKQFYDIVNFFKHGIEKKAYTLKDLNDAVEYIDFLTKFGLK